MKKKLLLILLALLLAAVMIAASSCGKEPDGAEPAASGTAEAPDPGEGPDDLTKETYGVMTAEDLLDKFVQDRTAATPDEFAALINTLRFVDIEDKDDTDVMELADNATEEAVKLLQKEKGDPELHEWFETLLESRYPQVRGFVTSRIGDASSEDKEAILNALKDETDNYVLFRAIYGLSARELKYNESVKDFIFRMCDAEYYKLRAHCIYDVSDSMTQGMPDCLEKALKLLADENMVVRGDAAGWIGQLADDSVIEPLVAILNDPAQAEIHDDCIRSLSAMWLNYPFFKNRSEKAYRATIDYFSRTPRDSSVPPWNALFWLHGAGGEEDLAQWKAETSYYDADEIYGLIKGIITDPQANSMLRGEAIQVVEYLCTEEQFDDLKAVIEGLSDSSRDSLLQKYESVKNY